MTADEFIAIVAGLAGQLLSNWQVATAGALAALVGFAWVGRTASQSITGWLLQPVRILGVAALAFPFVLILLNIGIAQWRTANYSAVAFGAGLGFIIYMLFRGLVIPPGGK